jgi:hypothetical protein
VDVLKIIRTTRRLLNFFSLVSWTGMAGYEGERMTQSQNPHEFTTIGKSLRSNRTQPFQRNATVSFSAGTSGNSNHPTPRITRPALGCERSLHLSLATNLANSLKFVTRITQ